MQTTQNPNDTERTVNALGDHYVPAMPSEALLEFGRRAVTALQYQWPTPVSRNRS